MKHVRFCFADHVLDVDLRELTRAGEGIAVEPQVFDLLIYLVENRERVVSKDDLIAAVWGGRIVSDATIDSRIKAARQAGGRHAMAMQRRAQRGGDPIVVLDQQDVHAPTLSGRRGPCRSSAFGAKPDMSVIGAQPQEIPKVLDCGLRRALASRHARRLRLTTPRPEGRGGR